MRNKKTENMLSGFPGDTGFVKNQNDPLNIIVSTGGNILLAGEESLTRNTDNRRISFMDPKLPTKVYNQKVNFFNTDRSDGYAVSIDRKSKYLGTAEIVENDEEFRSNRITGLFKNLADPQPDEIIGLPDGIINGIGLSYGFDWSDPIWYFTMEGDNNIHSYKRVADEWEFVKALDIVQRTTPTPEFLNIEAVEYSEDMEWDTTAEKTFSLPGFVLHGSAVLTYIEGEEEKVVDDSLYTIEPFLSGVSEFVLQPLLVPVGTVTLTVSYKYQYAVTGNLPTSNLVIRDAFNMADPTQGMLLTQEEGVEAPINQDNARDYIWVDNVLYFNNLFAYYTSDLENGPTSTYSSRYIATYNYNGTEMMYYLAPDKKRHFLGLVGVPRYRGGDTVE